MNSQAQVGAKRLAVLLCGFLAFAGNVYSQTTQTSSRQSTWSVGAFEFSLNSDWTAEQRQTNSLVLVHSTESANSNLAVKSIPLANRTPDEAARTYLRKLAGLPRTSSEKSLVRHWQLAQGKTVVGHQAWLGQSSQTITAVIAGDADLLTVALANKHSQKTESQRHSAQQALGNLIKTLANRTTTSTSNKRWPEAGEGISGFYATIGGSNSQSNRQASFSAHRRVMGVAGLRLDSNGWFALSEQGLDKTIESVCEFPAQICGRYSADGDSFTTWRSMSKLEERVSFMRKRVWSLKREPDDSLLIGGERHLRVNQPEAQLLNGRYRAARRSGTRYEETVFSFFDDGQFEESGFVANSGTSGSPISLSATPAAKEGSFEVDGFTLVLTYLDGERKTHSLFLLGSATVIDGNMFQRLLEPTVETKAESKSESESVD